MNPCSPMSPDVPLEAHPLSIVLKARLNAIGCYEFRQGDRRLVLDISVTRVRFGEHDMSGVVIVRDVTERKRAEEYLQRRNLELAALNALAQALSSSLESQDLLDEALSRTVHTLGFAGGLTSLSRSKNAPRGLPNPRLWLGSGDPSRAKLDLLSLADERTGDPALSSYTG